MKLGEFIFTRERDVGYITPGAGLAGESFAKIIRNDEVKSRPWFHVCAG
jgi:hypothetical protein